MDYKKLGVIAGTGIIGLSMLAGASSLVYAQTDNTNLNFFERLANKLGIDQTKFTNAAKDVQYEIVDEKVAEGKLDQIRADQIKQRIKNSEGFEMGMGFGHEWGERRGGFGNKTELLSEFLGVSFDEIKTLKDEGLTKDEILFKYGKTLEEFRTFMEENRPEGRGRGMGFMMGDWD